MLTHLEQLAEQREVSVDMLEPLEVVLAEKPEDVEQWREVMRTFHYLPPRRASMGTLKYLVYSGTTLVAALSFAGAGYKLKTRDELLGRFGLDRLQAQGRLVVNSRFLILPYIRVKNLASAVLSRVLERLVEDWKARWGKSPLLVETFVDPERFTGTCYRATNWLFWGYTQGSGRRGKSYAYHGKPKAIYIYPLEPQLRALAQREQESIVGPRSVLRRPREASIDPERWDPEETLAQMVDDDLRALARLLVDFHREFSPAFSRRRQEQLSLSYLSGLLSAVDRKNVERMAQQLVGVDEVRPLQRFLKKSPWKEDPVRERLHARVAEEIGEPDGMLAVDSTEFPKKGTESVGVARQYCGQLGKIENCQSGVFVSYVSRKNHCLVEHALYLPESWFSEERRRRWAVWDIPEETRFRTKPQIAVELVHRIWSEARLPFRWVGCDTFLGDHLDWLEKLPPGVWFMAQVSSNTRVWLKEPEFETPSYRGHGRPPSRRKPSSDPVEVRSLLDRNDLGWKEEVLFVGSKGPVTVRLLILRVWLAHRGEAKGPYWLLIRQSLDGKETKYFLSNAPEDTSRRELKRALGMRWEIEHSFHLAKGKLGMRDYQTRSLRAWNRHMLYVELAMLFLLLVQRHFKKNPTPESRASSRPDRHGDHLAGADAPPSPRGGPAPNTTPKKDQSQTYTSM